MSLLLLFQPQTEPEPPSGYKLMSLTGVGVFLLLLIGVLL